MPDATTGSADGRTALVLCYSRLESDPRVMRQIRWLSAAGWTVDTLGFGPRPASEVRRHFELGVHSGPRRSALIRVLIHAALPYPARYRLLDGALVPSEIVTQGPAYDLVVANELELLPWLDGAAPGLVRSGGRVHLDLHEYHRWEARGSAAALRRLLFAGYHRWHVGFIGSDRVNSRTSVAPAIAELYAADHGVAVPAVVRNSPDFLDLEPSAVDPDRIELLYHGNADPARGLGVLVDAMRSVRPEFRLTLMLTGRAEDVEAMRRRVAEVDRIEIVPPVPMSEVSEAINRYDVELMLFPPTTPNFRFVLPNKLFEAIQGRLGVVIGPSPSMVPIVKQFGLGPITDGWTADDLARAIDSLDADAVRAMKSGAGRAALAINAATEGRSFLAAVGSSD